MDQAGSIGKTPELSRRDFLRSAAAAGAGLVITRAAIGQATAPAAKDDDLNVAIVGAGSQGRHLLMNSLRIPGIRFKAVCDIWSFSQTYAANIIRRHNQLRKVKDTVNVYADYRDLLAKEKGLDAVLIATPDWVHAEQTAACLKAGLHVYCEKEMSNTLAGCRQMVAAARASGKQLQIGHQRRSNPRYWHALKMIHKDKILGRITNAYGQWHREVQPPLGPSRKYPIDAATLKKYGYDTVERFRNWRWHRKFSGGPIADLGSHQVDIFNWFLKTPPATVVASGGLDYYRGVYKDAEWYDNILAIYEYAGDAGPVRALYEVLNTTSYGGFYEVFLGDQGSLVVSEDKAKGFLYREVQAKAREWEDKAEKVASMGMEGIKLLVGETREKTDPKVQQMVADTKKPAHQPHLENFYDAVRGRTGPDGEKVRLNCPADVAYETAVTVLRVNESVASGEKIAFQAGEFKA